MAHRGMSFTDMDETMILSFSDCELRGVDIAEIAGVSYSSVVKILSKYGKTPLIHGHRLYPIDESYFSIIDTQNKAYFLGLLYADGHNDTKRGIVHLGLQEEDVCILESLRSELHTELPIKTIHKEHLNQKNIKKINIISRLMSQDLERHGVVHNKTHHASFPNNIKEELIPHFIRGVFDGDGHGDNCNGDFTGNHLLCEGIADILRKELGIHVNHVIRHPDKSPNIISLRFGGQRVMCKFFNYIYRDANIFLQRKKVVFDDIIKKHTQELGYCDGGRNGVCYKAIKQLGENKHEYKCSYFN